MSIDELNDKLKTFDIPENNRLLVPRNVMWLLRNLPIRNSNNPHLIEVLKKLKELMSREIYYPEYY